MILMEINCLWEEFNEVSTEQTRWKKGEWKNDQSRVNKSIIGAHGDEVSVGGVQRVGYGDDRHEGG